jgi:Methyltransferase domain
VERGTELDAWTGASGDEYHERHAADDEARESLWDEVLELLPSTHMAILEVGAGMGANLHAIRRFYSTINLAPRLYALEPNGKARARLAKHFTIIPGTAESIESGDRIFDFVFTYRVLIHLSDPLPAMREIYGVSNRYILAAECFSPRREQIPYQNEVPLFKDDYGSVWLEEFKDLELIDYGFCWKRATGLDNVTWWLFEKNASPNT